MESLKIRPEEAASTAAKLTATGNPRAALKLLKKQFREGAQVHPLVRVELAGAYLRLSMFTTAQRQLDACTVHSKRFLIYSAYATMYRFDLESAYSLLERAMGAPDLTKKEGINLKLNAEAVQLMAKLDRVEDAWGRLAKLADQAQAADAPMHALQCFELSARSAAFVNDLDSMRRFALSGLALLQKGDTTLGSSFAPLLERWLAYEELVRTGRSQSYEAIKEQIRTGLHHQVLREMDWLEGRSKACEHLINQSYHGTSIENYRKFILKMVPNFSPSPSFDWRFGRSDFSVPSYPIELPVEIRPGFVLHKLVLALSRDFYHRLTLPELFDLVGPGREYEPDSSSLAMRQLLFRLRRVLSKSQSPLRIISRGSLVNLHAAAPWVLRVPLPWRAESLDRRNYLADQVWEFLSKEAVSPSLIARKAKVSKRSVNYAIKLLMEQGRAARIGSGRNAKYTANSSHPAKKS